MFGPDFGKEPNEMQVVISFDVSTGELCVAGCDKNPIVALGLLEYAMARVRRVLLQNDLNQEMQNAPRVSLSHRVVS